MKKLFTKHKGIVLPLNISDIDTDIIIPKQFLKKIKKKGFGKKLFYNWRYIDEKGKKINKNFIMNKATYKNSTILLTRKNFGCGSSREHAVWALKEYGFKAIIAESFADIFYSNAINNRLLLISLKKKEIEKLFLIVKNNPFCEIKIKILKNLIKIKKHFFVFKLESYFKKCIINRINHIDVTLKKVNFIKKYEEKINSVYKRNLNKKNGN